MRDSSSHHRHAFAHIAAALVTLLAAITVSLYVLMMSFLASGPVLERSRLDLQQSIRITDRFGGTLYQFSSGEERIFLPGNVIPERVKLALIAIEDERFEGRRMCIDMRAILRVVKVAFFEGDIQGASTLTQQLVRLLYLSPEKTLTRKTHEILLACRLEFLLSKEEILTLYLNGVSFGNGLNGIETASQSYFGIPASELSVAQAAALVSIPQRPSYFNPYGPNLRTSVDGAVLRAIRQGEMDNASLHPELMHTGILPRMIGGKKPTVLPGRSSHVIHAMRRLDFIDNAEADQAHRELLTLTFIPLQHPISAPHFSLRIRNEIENLLSVLYRREQWEASGITVRTTLDPVLQQLAENVLRDLRDTITNAGAKNASLVALDRRTRRVVAYVGNIDYFSLDTEGQIDMARVPRQPGSSFKPLIYAGAFELGYSPNSVVVDGPLHIGTDQPKNYEGGYRGVMTLRSALAQSRNIPAIKLFLQLPSEDWLLDLAYGAGVRHPSLFKTEKIQEDSRFSYGWPIAIGSVEVPLLEMAQLYATISDHGIFKPLTFLCSVENRHGESIIDVPAERPSQAIDPVAADRTDEILRDSRSRPAGFWRNMLTIPGTETAAKTGTSNVCFRRDTLGRCTEYGVNNVWTLGYTDNLVVGVWVGNANNEVLHPLADGLTVAAPIWRSFIQYASHVYEPEKVQCE